MTELLNKKELVKRLPFSFNTLQSRIKNSAIPIPFYQFDGLKLYDYDEVINWIKNYQKKSPNVDDQIRS